LIDSILIFQFKCSTMESSTDYHARYVSRDKSSIKSSAYAFVHSSIEHDIIFASMRSQEMSKKDIIFFSMFELTQNSGRSFYKNISFYN